MKKAIAILGTAIAVVAATSCKTPTDVASTAAFANFSTECLGADGDGTETVRAWGKGNNKTDAIEQAKINAVRDIIFKGLTGAQGCNVRPLVTEVNAHEKYEDYFNAFFRKGGAFEKYVRVDEKRTSRLRAKHSTIEQYGVVVTVDRAALRQRLRDDNILLN